MRGVVMRGVTNGVMLRLVEREAERRGVRFRGVGGSRLDQLLTRSSVRGAGTGAGFDAEYGSSTAELG